ncbi:MAG: AAA family ATPase [Candidatus Omnitrophica bacterium]|nr:AAA family ATPase [Candidatus Omnitrophota bacterium]
MMNAAEINTTVMERFSRLAANHRLAHAYMLVGPRDSGKTQTALSLAQLVNCECPKAQPCGQCAVCLKIASGNHPDVYVIDSDDPESVKIENIRYLLGRTQLRAYEAKTKVFIIRNIEQMISQVANTLLKTLEEPTTNTLIILTTSVPEAVLDTIQSRCHIVKFLPSAVNRIIQFLKEGGIAEQDAHFLAVYSEGCLGRACQLAKQDIILKRNRILDDMLFNRRQDDFLKELSGDPLQAAVVLGLLLSFFRDVLLLKSGAPSSALVHQGCLKEQKTFALREMADLSLIIRQIVQTKKLLDEHLNARMSFFLLREYLWAN